MEALSRRAVVLGVLAVLGVSACEDNAELSASRAVSHADFLAQATARDVEEVRKGLPEGAKKQASLWQKTERDVFI